MHVTLTHLVGTDLKVDVVIEAEDVEDDTEEEGDDDVVDGGKERKKIVVDGAHSFPAKDVEISAKRAKSSIKGSTFKKRTFTAT